MGEEVPELPGIGGQKVFRVLVVHLHYYVQSRSVQVLHYANLWSKSLQLRTCLLYFCRTGFRLWHTLGFEDGESVRSTDLFCNRETAECQRSPRSSIRKWFRTRWDLRRRLFSRWAAPGVDCPGKKCSSYELVWC